MDFWNQKNILPPPTNTYKTSDKSLDLVKLRNALQSGSNHFKFQEFLKKEAVLLSRIIYRMKMKFRSSKDFKLTEKVNHALKIFFSINMERDFKNLLNLVPNNYGKFDTYLPTKNMLSYILVRLQGLAKLMVRIYDTCIIAAEQINKRLILGHFWNIALILFALISRIFILVKFNTKFICELYGKLKSHLGKLRNNGLDWLPKGYELPDDLYEWLGVQWVYEEDYINLTLESTPKIIDFFDLANDEDDDVQFCDEYVLLDDEESSIIKDFKQLLPIQNCITRNRMRGFSISENDIGEEITDLQNKTAKDSEIIFIPDTPIANPLIEDNSVIALDATDTEEMHEDSVMYISGENTGHEKRDMDDIGEEIFEVKDSPKTIFFKTPKKPKRRVLNKNQMIDLEIKSTKDASLYTIEDDQDVDDIGEEIFEIKDSPKTIFFKTPKKPKRRVLNNNQMIDLEINATEDASLYTITEDDQESVMELKNTANSNKKKKKKRKSSINLEGTPRKKLRKSVPNISSDNINYLNTPLGTLKKTKKKRKNKVDLLDHSVISLETPSSVKKKKKNSLTNTSFVNNQTPLVNTKKSGAKGKKKKNLVNSPNTFVNQQASEYIKDTSALKIKKKNRRKKNSGLQSNFKETTKNDGDISSFIKTPKNKKKKRSSKLSAKKKKKQKL